MKRAIDLLLAALAMGVLMPILIGAALAVKLDSPGPVLFRQQRVGRKTRVFGMFKFRSMVHNAALIGPYFTASADARITRVGKVLRKTSIDELPQLLNVLIGDMSLVGPRPDVPAQEALYDAGAWQQRHLVRPGITGLAQAKIRSTGSSQERLALDLEYVANQSLWFDLKIMAWTLTRLTGRGGN